MNAPTLQQFFDAIEHAKACFGEKGTAKFDRELGYRVGIEVQDGLFFIKGQSQVSFDSAFSDWNTRNDFFLKSRPLQ